MRIDSYEPVVEDGKVHFYAVAGKKRYLMPDAYKDMYNEHYLEITKTVLKRPEIYGIEPDTPDSDSDSSEPVFAEVWIPRRTS